MLSLRLVILLDSNLWLRLKVVYDRSRSKFAQGSFQELLDVSAHLPFKKKNVRSRGAPKA